MMQIFVLKIEHYDVLLEKSKFIWKHYDPEMSIYYSGPGEGRLMALSVPRNFPIGDILV